MPGASRWLDEKPSGTAIADAASSARASSSLRIASPPLRASEADPLAGRASRCKSLSWDFQIRITRAHETRAHEKHLAAVHVTLAGQTRLGHRDDQLQATRAFDPGGPPSPQRGA